MPASGMWPGAFERPGLLGIATTVGRPAEESHGPKSDKYAQHQENDHHRSSFLRTVVATDASRPFGWHVSGALSALRYIEPVAKRQQPVDG